MAKRLRILVVGDWVVDDYWITGTHRTTTASRVGEEQLRALHHADSTVQTLVGAGRLASALHSAEFPNDQECTVVGLGLWHRDDTEHMRTLCTYCGIPGWTPNRLHWRADYRRASSRLKLVNIGDLLGRARVVPKDIATTRVIRIYRRSGAMLDAVERVDWELPPEGFRREGDADWVNDEFEAHFQQEAAQLRDLRGTFDAVVVKDLCKGVVSLQLIRWLAKRFGRAPWFISSKAWRPSWLDELHHVDVRLLLLPQVACKLSGIQSWFTKRTSRPLPTLDAMKAIDDVRLQLRGAGKGARVIALPNGYSALARDGATDTMVYQPDPEPISFRRDCAMASLFFASAIATQLAAPRMRLTDIVGYSLNYVELFAAAEHAWRSKPEVTGTDARFPQLSASPRRNAKPTAFPLTTVRDTSWSKTAIDWESALNGFGIIWNDPLPRRTRSASADAAGAEDAGDGRLELARVMTEVPDYVCCLPEKRQRIDHLMRDIRQFLAQPRHERRNVSGLLIAAPGSGKTSLIRGIGDALGLQCLDFNITQVGTREGLFACFDTILTTQAQQSDRAVLVFFDEINAKLEGQYVFDAFLAPLEDGAYLRSGKKYILQPCVWMFAATEAPAAVGESDASTKAADFQSRLTLEQVNLSSVADIERVYCGAAMIRKTFPDVQFVSEKVLQCFARLQVPLRELRRIVASFENVQYGRISFRNVAAKDRATFDDLVTPEPGKRKWIRIR